MLSTEANLSQLKVSNFVVFVGLALVLILHPLETLAMSPLNRCGNILRATSLRTRLALLGLGGAGLGLLTLPATHAFEQYANNRALRSLEKSSGDNVVGARYAQDLVAAGVMTPFRAQSLVTAYNVSLRESLRPLQMRIAQFRRLTLWTPDQAQVATRALERISKIASPLKSLNTASLRAQLIGDPSFKSMIQSLPESQNFTWSLLTEPTIFVDGRSDAAWLALFFAPDPHVREFTDSELAALTSLQSLYATHDPGLTLPMLTKMISESFAKSVDLEEKQQQARELGLNGSFVNRPDIPVFSAPLTYHDIDETTVLTGELDRWAVIFRNPHFADIRRAWSSGQISDFKALSQAEILIRGRGQVFKIYNSFTPSLALTADSACRVLYGDIGASANPLFNAIRQLTSSPAVQIRLAQIRYAAMIETARESNSGKIEQTMARSREAEKQVLSDAREGVLNLPTPQVSCGTIQAAQPTQIKF